MDIIWAHPRTGSSTLLRILNCLPGQRFLGEPFNSNKEYYRLARNPKEIDAALAGFAAEYTGIKHVWIDAYPFGAKHMNQHLLLSGERVFVLQRRNALKRIVSRWISMMSGVWFASPENRAIFEAHSFRAIQIRDIASELRSEPDARRWPIEVLTAAKKPFVELWYEDLYEVDSAAQRAKLAELFAFLGATPTSETFEQAAALLDPKVSRLNSLATYQRIPNIEEINRTCGSDEMGRLW